jgi:microcystin-dependent protein
MSLETAQYIHQLNAANPSGSDKLKDGDDHIRMIKAALKATFPGITGPLASTVTHEFLNALVGTAIVPGSIMLFSGTVIPAGWGICDGSTYPRADGSGEIVSPDLRDRVPVGASDGHPVGSKFGATTRTANTTAAGEHTHGVTIPAHSHSVSLSGSTGSAGDQLNTTTQTTYAGGGSQQAIRTAALQGGGHTHSVTLSGNTGNSEASTGNTAAGGAHTHSVSVDVTQPSIAIHFIIKL